MIPGLRVWVTGISAFLLQYLIGSHSVFIEIPRICLRYIFIYVMPMVEY